MTESPHSLSAPYALDALDDLERARFEAHLDDCDDCREELFGFVETAAHLGGAESMVAPPALRGRILTQVAITPQARLITAPPKWRRRLSSGLMAAAMVLGVAGVGGYVVEHQRAQDVQSENVAMSTVLGDPDARTIDTRLDGGNLRVVVSAANDAAVVVSHDLPELEAGTVYQLWMIDADGPKPQDTFTSDGAMIMRGGIDGAETIALTIEPEGGSQQPTTDPVATIPV